MLSLTKTERIINGIKKNDSFENVAYVCEDFETFIIEVAEWGVDHISQVDFDDPELDLEILDAFLLHSVALQVIRTHAQSTQHQRSTHNEKLTP